MATASTRSRSCHLRRPLPSGAGRQVAVGQISSVDPATDPRGSLRLDLRLHLSGRPRGSSRPLEMQLPSSKASAFLRCSKHHSYSGKQQQSHPRAMLTAQTLREWRLGSRIRQGASTARRAQAEHGVERRVGTLPWLRDQAWLIQAHTCCSHSHRMRSASRPRVPTADPSRAGSSYLTVWVTRGLGRSL